MMRYLMLSRIFKRRLIGSLRVVTNLLRGLLVRQARQVQRVRLGLRVERQVPQEILAQRVQEVQLARRALPVQAVQQAQQVVLDWLETLDPRAQRDRPD